MKGGLLAGTFATAVLQDAGFDAFDRITYVCNPDEEIGSPFSGPVIGAIAAEHDATFVLECARANGAIVSARKGVTDYGIRVTGRAAHAGVEPSRGRSAVLEAAHKAIAISALTGRWPGVTCNVGVLRGGTRPNVVPEDAVLEIDLRSPELATLEEAERRGGADLPRATIPTCRSNCGTMAGTGRWRRPRGRSVSSTWRSRWRPTRLRARGRGHGRRVRREHDERGGLSDPRRARPDRRRRTRVRRVAGPGERRPRVALLAGLITRL